MMLFHFISDLKVGSFFYSRVGKKACYGGTGPPDKVPCYSKSGCGRRNKKCNKTSDCCCGFVCVGGGDRKYNDSLHIHRVRRRAHNELEHKLAITPKRGYPG